MVDSIPKPTTISPNRVPTTRAPTQDEWWYEREAKKEWKVHFDTKVAKVSGTPEEAHAEF
jgi:hypothetical protein